jgi:hypothetical protein
MKHIHEVTATPRQTAIVARDQQLFAEHPTLVVICRPYRVREAPQIAVDPATSAKVALADADPEAWAMVVVNAIAMTYRLLVRREQARGLYETVLREYRKREPRATGRYELGIGVQSDQLGDVAS